MANVLDAAQYIIELFREKKRFPITAWKLQKLVYYCQAWATVWDDKAIFDEPIQAWANGPVCPALYKVHKGNFEIYSIPAGRPAAIGQEHKETIKAVFDHYGDLSAQQLSDLTHMEAPWKEARTGLAPNARGDTIITLDAMAEYYRGLNIKAASQQFAPDARDDDDSDDTFLVSSGVLDKLLSQVGNCPPSKDWEAELDEL